MDCVRARNTSVYGYLRDTTPFLSNFLDTATVYEHAVAPGHWSLPSHASLFTGYHVNEHGLTSRNYCLEPGHTIWEQLAQSHDYSTGVFSSNPFLTESDFGLNRGFDTIVSSLRDIPFREGVAPTDYEDVSYLSYVQHCLDSEHTRESIINGIHAKAPNAPVISRLYPETEVSFAEEFLSWQSDVSGPWGACINFMEAHGPYADSQRCDHWEQEYFRQVQSKERSGYAFQCGAAHWSERTVLENLYDCGILTIDNYIEQIIDTLAQRNVLDETLVVITSDHGEGFGEQSNVRPANRIHAHNFGLHEVLLHVPLVVKLPGQTEGDRVAETVSLTDFPRVVDELIAGNATTQSFLTTNPVLAAGQNNRIHEYRELIEEHCATIDRFTGEIRTTYFEDEDGKGKFIQWGADEAKVRIPDTRVTEKVSQSASEEIDSAFGTVEDRQIRMKKGEADEQTKQRLKELGYRQ